MKRMLLLMCLGITMFIGIFSYDAFAEDKDIKITFDEPAVIPEGNLNQPTGFELYKNGAFLCGHEVPHATEFYCADVFTVADITDGKIEADYTVLRTGTLIDSDQSLPFHLSIPVEDVAGKLDTLTGLLITLKP